MRGTSMVSLELVGTAHDGRSMHALFGSAHGAIGIAREGTYVGAAEMAYEGTRHGPYPFSLNWRVEHGANDAVVLLLEDRRGPPAEWLRRRIVLGAVAPPLRALGPF